MIITIRSSTFDVESNGNIKRKLKSGKWKTINNNANHNKGYNVILINKKQFMRSKIIAHAFLNLNINENIYLIYHIDGDKLNNSICNLGLILKNKNK